MREKWEEREGKKRGISKASDWFWSSFGNISALLLIPSDETEYESEDCETIRTYAFATMSLWDFIVHFSFFPLLCVFEKERERLEGCIRKEERKRGAGRASCHTFKHRISHAVTWDEMRCTHVTQRHGEGEGSFRTLWDPVSCLTIFSRFIFQRTSLYLLSSFSPPISHHAATPPLLSPSLFVSFLFMDWISLHFLSLHHRSLMQQRL